MGTSLPDIVRLLLTAFNALLILYAVTRIVELGASPKGMVTSRPAAPKPKKRFARQPKVQKTPERKVDNVKRADQQPKNESKISEADLPTEIKVKEDKPEPKPKPKNSPNEPLTFSDANELDGGSAQEDDLTKIEGIGPKSEQTLQKAGIATYDDLAKLSAEEIKEILVRSDNRYGMYDVTTWPRQAKLAAAGEWENLDRFKSKLTKVNS